MLADDYLEVQVKFEQFYEDGESTELTNWLGADGTVEDWYFDITVDDDWVDPDETYTLVYARALNAEGEASMVDLRVIRFARMSVTVNEPALGTPLVGLVEFEGSTEGTEHDRIEYKIDNGDWVVGDTLFILFLPTAEGTPAPGDSAGEQRIERLLAIGDARSLYLVEGEFRNIKENQLTGVGIENLAAQL